MTWITLSQVLTSIGMRPNNSTRSMLFGETHPPGVCVGVSDRNRYLKSDTNRNMKYRVEEYKNMLAQSRKHGTVL
ncbi:hypothetical protein Plim_4119 [Planctopirus limnophila DSM 3776]|uniref:Uncharacterized protein n=1 Tax=Planctopirus limnophila (strain ATCC 43296 / DSM 3776 / IFAM 1008 / Mu 290) TaxID=521674 RepID=D5SZ29_PLAL2|nr:hypothetical protein Plim_4119 [Planctopirus limnophila DSM 3776]